MGENTDFDSELIEKCILFDEKACERLYALHSPWLFSVCLRYASNKDDAQDMLQESFILIFNNLKKYSREGSFKGWMRKITVNCALGTFRKAANKISTQSIDASQENNVIDISFLENLEVDELRYFIDLLSPGRKQVFNAYVVEGYSHKEIAEQLGISEGTSKSQLFDAKRELKLAIEQHFAHAKTRIV